MQTIIYTAPAGIHADDAQSLIGWGHRVMALVCDLNDAMTYHTARFRMDNATGIYTLTVSQDDDPGEMSDEECRAWYGYDRRHAIKAARGEVMGAARKLKRAARTLGLVRADA